MECDQTTWLTDKEFFQEFRTKLIQQRIPIAGSIALTRHCNVHCVHCYIGPKASNQQFFTKEMTTNQILSLLDQISEAGCLYLLITGGEPLCRPDFPVIYRHAKRTGFVITLFTNGTLITEEVIELFHEYPPNIVEISLYGATPSTYEKITGVKGSFQRCVNGIERLLQNSIHMRLKTILMSYNSHEFYDIEKMVKTYGVPFRFDAAIFPCLNGNRDPLMLRVPPLEAVEKEFSDTDRAQKWHDYHERIKNAPPSDKLYNCGAGLTNFHIDSDGTLQPCLMTTQYAYNLLNGSFIEGWSNEIPRLREKKADTKHSCNECERRTLCGYCPAFFELETKSENIISEYLCIIGKYRFQFLQENGL